MIRLIIRVAHADSEGANGYHTFITVDLQHPRLEDILADAAEIVGAEVVPSIPKGKI